jgi:alpha-tubulin suppressor-like RCC1 family protein
MERNISTLISSLNGITQISAGYYHSLGLINGSLYSFGKNDVCPLNLIFKYGQLGQGDTIQRATPTLISSLNGVVQISAGAYHTIVLKNDSNVYSFGRNDVRKESLMF